MKITWLGHNAWAIEAGELRLLVDPFLNDSPTSPVKADDVEADYVLLSHGHGDHLGDTVAIAQRTGATVLTNYELSVWLASQGVAADHCVGMNPGGGYDLPGGRVKMTPACHSSSLPDGSYAGVAMGIDLRLGGRRVYFACDTSLFGDMRLLGDPAVSGAKIDLAVLPIGDLFTMGPDDAVTATGMLAPAVVAPCHYNTFPPIQQDAAEWAAKVQRHTGAEPVVLQPGESITL